MYLQVLHRYLQLLLEAAGAAVGPMTQMKQVEAEVVEL
jgi:hypothetical protein